ncbi:MAG TPA: ester cyclase [Rubrobacter sp.]
MSDQDRNKALLRRLCEEFWSKGDLEAIPELLAQDFFDHRSLLGTPPGREGLATLETTRRTAFPVMRKTCEDLIAKGDQILCRLTMHGTPMNSLLSVPPTGRRVTMSGIDIVRAAGGKIAGFCYGEHLRQLGAVPGFAADYAGREER